MRAGEWRVFLQDNTNPAIKKDLHLTISMRGIRRKGDQIRLSECKIISGGLPTLVDEVRIVDFHDHSWTHDHQLIVAVVD